MQSHFLYCRVTESWRLSAAGNEPFFVSVIRRPFRDLVDSKAKPNLPALTVNANCADQLCVCDVSLILRTYFVSLFVTIPVLMSQRIDLKIDSLVWVQKCTR